MRHVAQYIPLRSSPFGIAALKRLCDSDDARSVLAEHAPKLRNILARLDVAKSAADMDLPGFRLHALKGEREGFWAVTVRANWRITFRFDGTNATDVDYVDYH